MKKIASQIYLLFTGSTNFPASSPAHMCAKGVDLILLIVPILGWIAFVAIIENRYSKF